MNTRSKANHPLLQWVNGTDSIWYAGMFGTVFFFVLSGIALTARLTVLGDDADLIGHTHKVIQTLDELYGSVRDTEAAVRGYVITGGFLEDTVPSRATTKDRLLALAELVKDNPNEQQHLRSTTAKISEYEEFAQSVVTARTMSLSPSGAELVRTGRGRKLLEEIQVEVSKMRAIEEELLTNRLARFEKTRLGSKLIAALTICIVVGLTFLTRYLDKVFRGVRRSLVLESSRRREADEALRFSEERFQTALRDRPLRVYSVDKNLRYMWIHDPANKQGPNPIIGKRDDEIFGEPVVDLIRIQEQVIETEEPVRKVLSLPYSGDHRTYDVTVEPNRSDSGEVIGATISAFDIQTQIDYQASLRESADEFRLLADAVPQLVWSAGEDAVTDYFNNRWYEFTGIDPDNNTAALRQGQIHPEDRAAAIESWEASVRSKTPYEYEYRIKNGKTGEYRWFIVRAIPIFAADGRILRWFGTSTDIEEQKRLGAHNERLLISERSAREDLQKALAAKDEYVASLSHELRGPLNSILGWTQILTKKSADPALVTRGIDVIERNARIQSQLVSDLFDMHRISAGKLTLEVEDIHLSDLTEAAADTILPICQEKNIKLTRLIQPSICKVPGEGRRITQVLLNLLNNSIKFTPAGGEITIALISDGDQAIIEVRDTGAGIDANSISSIFDRYNQGSFGGERKQGGLGLGLAIARSFVEMHRGTIDVFSEGPGKGSTFRISIPCNVEKTADPNTLDSGSEALRGDAADLSGITVFVVEDQDDAREATTRILSEHGADAIGCSSAIEALAKLELGLPDVVVSDISMPGMDGYALMREVRRIAPELPGIALTAFSRPEDKLRATEAGFRMHITKPLEATKLVTAIYSLIKEQ